MTLKPLIKYLKETPTWVWLALFLISAIITTQQLRHNNFEMIKLRNAVYASDKSGKGVDQALNNLRGYVYAHMNTDLSSGGNTIKPPIQLQYTYQRLVAAEQKRVNEATQNIYRDAQSYCLAHEASQYREDCFKRYVDAHDVKANSIPAALYQFDFAGPAWSPDLAGWSLIVSVLLVIVAATSFLADELASFRLKHFRRTN